VKEKRMYESEIEDYLEAHPKALFDYGVGDLYNPSPVVIGRQVQLCHGIADLLIWCNRLYVIELKATGLKEKDICQVLRYANDVNIYLLALANELYRSSDLDQMRSKFYGYALDKFDESYVESLTFRINGYYPPVCPVLIGKSVSENILAAMDSIHGETFIWEEDVAGFTFAQLNAERSPNTPAMSLVPEWLVKTGELALEMADENAQIADRIVAKALFGKNAEIQHG